MNKTQINKTITTCVLMIYKKPENQTSIIKNNFEYVQEFMTIETFTAYIVSKLNMLKTDIF